MGGSTLKVGVIKGPFGNVSSVMNAFRYIGIDARLIQQPEDFRNVSHLVLPGVGSFWTAMDFLEAAGMTELIRLHAQAGDPVLGICLGSQLLMESGSEGGVRTGLGLIRGSVHPLSEQVTGLPLPHTGWNFVAAEQGSSAHSPVPSGHYYFNHEYIVSPNDPGTVLASTHYGVRFPVAVQSDNVTGVQFHPEKSQAVGMSLLRAFAEGTTRMAAT